MVNHRQIQGTRKGNLLFIGKRKGLGGAVITKKSIGGN